MSERHTHILLILFALGAVLLGAGHDALAERRPERIDEIDPVGKRLVYSVHLGNIRFGTQKMDITSAGDPDGQEVQIRGMLKTTGVAKLFFRLKDEWSIDVLVPDYLPYRIERRILERKSREHYVYDIDPGRDRIEIRNLSEDAVRILSTTHVVLDRFTLLFYYRRNPTDINDTLTFELLERNATRTVTLRNRGTVETNIVPSQKHPRMTETLIYEAMYGDKLEVYLQPKSMLPLKILFTATIREEEGPQDVVLYLRSVTPLTSP
jgi:hypothetical protein